MKKKLILTATLFIIVSILHAQTIFEFSFQYPATTSGINYKLLFIDNNDGTGKVRLKFTTADFTDTVIADYNVKEQVVENTSVCNLGDRLYYKLQNPSFIDSKNPGVNLPQNLWFTKEDSSGLYIPAGVSDSVTACEIELVKFNTITNMDKAKLTKDFVLGYFKNYEPFYKSLFVTNNSKALTITEQNIKLYLLFVANVTDKEIGIGDRKNMNEAISFFGKVKEFLGISAFIYDTITGANFNRQTVLNKINNLTPGPNDIVIFYYSGHGYRKPKDGWPGPYIDLRDLVLDRNKSYLDNSLSTEEILGLIRKKGARLNLIISESCNDIVTSTNPIAQEPPGTGKKGGFGINWSTKNCRDLFLNAKPTTILAYAASPYQLAVSNPDFGGYFSTFFRNAIEANLGYSKTNVNWDDIISLTRRQTEEMASRTWCNKEKTIKCKQQQPDAKFFYGMF